MEYYPNLNFPYPAGNRHKKAPVFFDKQKVPDFHHYTDYFHRPNMILGAEVRPVIVRPDLPSLRQAEYC